MTLMVAAGQKGTEAIYQLEYIYVATGNKLVRLPRS